MNYHPQDIPVSQSRLFLKLWQKKKKPLREKEPDRNRERSPKQASPELHRRLLWFSTLNSEDIFSHPGESMVLFALLLASPEAARNKKKLKLIGCGLQIHAMIYSVSNMWLCSFTMNNSIVCCCCCCYMSSVCRTCHTHQQLQGARVRPRLLGCSATPVSQMYCTVLYCPRLRLCQN